MAAIVAAFALRERQAIVRSLRIEALTGHDWLWTGAVFVGLAVVVEAWFWLAAQMFDILPMLEPFRTHGWPAWSAVVLLVVCPAVIEEIAFRGFLLERLTALIGRRDALLLQGALFAILHMSPVVLPSHFAMGVAFGWLRQRTGSLVPGMLVHGAWNLTVLLQEGLLRGW
jgi:membrane protease YdiL (CAAX protease family)